MDIKLIFGRNMVRFRRKLGFTQQQLANRLGIARATVGAYEQGRAAPPLEVMGQLADCFGCSVDELVKEEVVRLPGGVRHTDPAGERLRVLSVAVDGVDQREQITLVPVQAAAGYLEGHRDPDFVARLPQFMLPVSELNPNRSYRMFQIKGDSMHPLPDGSYLIAEFVRDWQQLRDYQCCVVVSTGEGVVFKRIKNHLNEGYLELISDNPAYQPYRMTADQLLEVWRVKAYLSFDLPDPHRSPTDEAGELLGRLRQLLDQYVPQQNSGRGWA
jgi:transcriptional regulator with XRE-family HTH domain